ncbi:RAD51-associated protein 1 isoform X1 [Lacerta agilis]|uniref:RAD51-associated protein 1 isoform X1 n=1 Tax=Lacerta agilis TaxID=80427 RepID=UPI001419F58F|nr:RAD51-associated protein 1 isoform X1 [Lacerta agilis]
MARPPRRNKKAVDYSQFGSVDEDDDDEDFANITAPSSKKSKRTCSELTKKKMEQKPPKQEIQFQKSSPNKRLALDHRLYQRDLEVALALSMDEPPGRNHKVQDSQKQAEKSEGDSSFSEDDDVEFVVKKKATGNRKEGRQINAESRKKEKKHSKSERDSIGLLPAKSESALQNLSSSLEQIGQPLKTSGPSFAKKPNCMSPATSGSSAIQLGRTHVKSPTQGLRLGLSRLARVKSLHPSFAST